MQGHEYTTTDIVIWSLLLIGLIVAGWLTVWHVKRRLQNTDEVLGNAGFTLSDLRQLHKSGQMSDEEFEKAKGRVLESARRAAHRDAGTPGQAHAAGRAPRPTIVDPTSRPPPDGWDDSTSP
jgi:hypothetical protein